MLVDKDANLWEALEYSFVVGGIREFGGQVLASPVLVVHPTTPQAAFGNVVDSALIGDIDLFFILPIEEGELMAFELFHSGSVLWSELVGSLFRGDRASCRVESKRGVCV